MADRIGGPVSLSQSLRETARLVRESLEATHGEGPEDEARLKSAAVMLRRLETKTGSVPLTVEQVARVVRALEAHRRSLDLAVHWGDEAMGTSATTAAREELQEADAVLALLREAAGRSEFDGGLHSGALPQTPRKLPGPRCGATYKDGAVCSEPKGHPGLHVEYSGDEVTGSWPNLEEEVFHPTGRCDCGGEGRCQWCRTHCAGCGIEQPDHLALAEKVLAECAYFVRAAPRFGGVLTTPADGSLLGRVADEIAALDLDALLAEDSE